MALNTVEHPSSKIVGVQREWLQDWVMELVHAAQDGDTMSNQINRLGILQAPLLCGAERVEGRGFRVQKNGFLQMNDQSELSLRLIPAPDDLARFGADYQAELRQFKGQLKAASVDADTRFAVFDSPGTVGGMTGEFLIPAAQIIVPALSVAAVAWMNGRAGRKLRLKVGDIELEASTQEDIDLLLAKALELKTSLMRQSE